MNIKRVVVGMLNTNCYILENNSECLIIDPGSEADKIKKKDDKKVVGILLTHRHFDHVGALQELASYYNVNVYDYNNLNEGENSIGSFSFYVQYNLGHTLDSISFIFEENMFSGDFIFKNAIGRCDLGGNFELMRKSINIILKSTTNYRIFPGHGEITYLDDERLFLEDYK